MLFPSRLASALLLAGILASAACVQDDAERLQRIARDTCAKLDNALVYQADGILAAGQKRASTETEIGRSFPAAMRRECPKLMAAVDAINEREERRENLPNQMTVKVTGCYRKEAQGTVMNGSSVMVDVYVAVQFLDEDGVVLDDSLDSVNGLRAGETANWTAPYLGRGTYARCRANVGSVFEQ